MIILRNIPNAIKIIRATNDFGLMRKQIYYARDKGQYERERRMILLAESRWGKRLCESLGINIEVTGRENLPKEGPVVYVSNHQSYADIPVHCAVLDTIQFGFVAKKELRNLPVYGPFIEDIRSVLIDRTNPKTSMKAILQGISYINDGFSLLIFPEGTRSKGDEMGEFHAGSLKLATKPEVPVVPVTMDGSYRAFEDNGMFKGCNVKYTIHEPIVTKGMSREEKANLAERVEGIVRSALKDPR